MAPAADPDRAAGATSADDALDALRAKPFDLLFTDLMMPGMDGIQLLRAALEIDPDLVGIIMTGQGSVPTAVEAMKVGAFDYLLKPFKLQAVLPVLARALEVRRLRVDNRRLRRYVERLAFESPRYRLVGSGPAMQNVVRLIEVAEGGTLFIDEVAEMAPSLQAKLLRVLEDGHYRRVGGTQERHADVRVVAATNKPLEEEQKAGRFREDLYYRLNVVTVTLPPLRDRREDIPELVEHLLATRPVGPRRHAVGPEALELLVRYDWPGNVRELANVIERAQILAAGYTITPDDLPEAVTAAAAAPAGDDGPFSLAAAERRLLGEALRHTHGNKLAAAKALGVSPRTLYRMIERYGLGGD